MLKDKSELTEAQMVQILGGHLPANPIPEDEPNAP